MSNSELFGIDLIDAEAKRMGLDRFQKDACFSLYREMGTEDALNLVDEYAKKNAAGLRAAEHGARFAERLCGVAA